MPIFCVLIWLVLLFVLTVCFYVLYIATCLDSSVQHNINPTNKVTFTLKDYLNPKKETNKHTETHRERKETFESGFWEAEKENRSAGLADEARTHHDGHRFSLWCVCVFTHGQLSQHRRHTDWGQEDIGRSLAARQ